MEKGSKAESAVQGYPTSAENYEKAFNSLKNRFGRDDLLVEYYTRELLALVLQNATNKEKKASVSEVYDKVSAHIRALETLGIATDNCATMLYPLVESSLPEEILRTWQCSAVNNATPAEGDETPNRLTLLLTFLEAEVKNVERIKMAVHGFSVTTHSDKKSKDAKFKSEPQKDQSTASALLSTEDRRKRCVFCNGNHENAACGKALKFSNEVRKSMIKDNGCCFKCLKRGHLSRNCKVKVVCKRCGKRHATLVCSDMNNAESNATKTFAMKPDESRELKECNVASVCSLPDVYLQTLRVVLYSNSWKLNIRAIIDDGSQRTYISTAKFLDYKPTGTVNIAHSLFGGVNTQSQPHDIYLVHMESIDGKYRCNFQAMNKDVICADIPSVKSGTWLEELHSKNITLCDLKTSVAERSEAIDLLIGADIAGKLLTGRKYDLSSGLTASETRLGWTIMGKMPTTERDDRVTTAVSMFITEAKISDLWSLDVLGIKNPSEKSDRILKEQHVKENFLRTVSFNENNRYSVNLPWVEDHAPISRNFELASKRLEYTVKKLKNDDLLDEYNNVFSEWLDEGIIEVVPEKELNSFAHYLPHRPVIKRAQRSYARFSMRPRMRKVSLP